MAKINIEEVEAVIADQKAKREQALAQANFHTGCLMTWEELLKRLREPDEAEQEQVNPETWEEMLKRVQERDEAKQEMVNAEASAGNGAANVRQMPAKAAKKRAAVELGQ